MSEWWAGLTLFQQVYYCAAILSTAVLMIQTVLMFIGFLRGERTEKCKTQAAAGAVQKRKGLRLFNVRSVCSFLVIFGWVGAALLASGTGFAVALTVSVVCGFGAMLLISLCSARQAANADVNKDEISGV